MDALMLVLTTAAAMVLLHIGVSQLREALRDDLELSDDGFDMDDGERAEPPQRERAGLARAALPPCSNRGGKSQAEGRA